MLEILDKISLVTYRLKLPPNLFKIHDAFHVSLLKTYSWSFTYLVCIKFIDGGPNGNGGTINSDSLAPY